MRAFLMAAFAVLCLASVADAKLKIGTTTPDLEALVKAVGGASVETFSIAKGTQDPHQIEAKPSFMVKFHGVDLVVSHGLDLETAWLDPLIRGARNPDIVPGTRGFLELGPQLEPIEVATGAVSRAQGDVHPNGNPHFHLDPIRLGRGAQLLAERMGELDPGNQNKFQSNAQTFQIDMVEKEKAWKARLAKTNVTEFVSYHKTFSYFANRFGIKNSLYLEPKPGIPPTASHIIHVINEMKARNIKIVLVENFFDDSIRKKLEKEISGLKVSKVPVYVGGEDGITSNADLIERLVSSLEKSVP